MTRMPILGAASALIALGACGEAARDAEVERAIDSINVIDDSDLSGLMLQAGDPDEAVAYFARASAEKPERVDLARGLAESLVRAGKPAEAARAWKAVLAHPEAGHADGVGLADALIRAGDWEGAEAALAAIPPTFETHRRYRLEAMIADSNEDWARADSFYEIAAGLTTTPAGIYNNWGYSRLTRGDAAGAERLFTRALTHDGASFTTKNNLVLARAAQRRYDLPILPMTQVERAELLHTAGLAAVKQGDVATGRSLLDEAVRSHPQHFEAAVRSLAALDGAG